MYRDAIRWLGGTSRGVCMFATTFLCGVLLPACAASRGDLLTGLPRYYAEPVKTTLSELSGTYVVTIYHSTHWESLSVETRVLEQGRLVAREYVLYGFGSEPKVKLLYSLTDEGAIDAFRSLHDLVRHTTRTTAHTPPPAEYVELERILCDDGGFIWGDCVGNDAYCIACEAWYARQTDQAEDMPDPSFALMYLSPETFNPVCQASFAIRVFDELAGQAYHHPDASDESAGSSASAPADASH